MSKGRIKPKQLPRRLRFAADMTILFQPVSNLLNTSARTGLVKVSLSYSSFANMLSTSLGAGIGGVVFSTFQAYTVVLDVFKKTEHERR